jgi:hypothetical protein
MSIPAACPPILDFFGIPLVIEPSPGQLSGDAGLLPVRLFDQRMGLTRSRRPPSLKGCTVLGCDIRRTQADITRPRRRTSGSYCKSCQRRRRGNDGGMRPGSMTLSRASGREWYQRRKKPMAPRPERCVRFEDARCCPRVG